MKPVARAALLVLAGGLAWATVASAPAEPTRSRGTFASRLLGPFAPLAAAIEWGRFDAAAGVGDDVRAWKHADRALLLAPEEADGWTFLAHHAVYDRGSPRRTGDPAERRRWVEIGLAVLERGEREARNPGPVAFKMGVVYISLANQAESERALPISRREAWSRAADAFERAAAAGEPVAAEAARLARVEALEGG
ncbi:MAG: hypothetical protein NTY35_17685 [Planctomycetota bacterium]|nr:hypothetical protein [Planctomycetota bacterium]